MTQVSSASSNAGQCQHATLARPPTARFVEDRDPDHSGSNGRLGFCCLSAKRVVHRGTWFTRMCFAEPRRYPRGNGCTPPRNDTAVPFELFLPRDGSSRQCGDRKVEEHFETALRKLGFGHRLRFGKPP